MSDIKYTKEMFELLPESEKNSEFIALESKTFLRDSWERFKANRLAFIGLIFITLMILSCFLFPLFSRYTYDGQNINLRNAGPSLQHWLGTDKHGRDMFIRVMVGGQISLAIGFASAAINLTIGIIYGGIAGYFGGKIDIVMMRIVDIIYALPDMLYVIMILIVFGNGIGSMLLAISVTTWVQMARQVRTQVMSLREMEFALAATVIGASRRRILFKHLIVNALGPIIVCLTMMVPSAIFTEAFLSFIGVGIVPPLASWGALANEGRNMIFTYPIQIVWPVVFICLSILALNFVGDGLGEALDAKR